MSKNFSFFFFRRFFSLIYAFVERARCDLKLFRNILLYFHFHTLTQTSTHTFLSPLSFSFRLVCHRHDSIVHAAQTKRHMTTSPSISYYTLPRQTHKINRFIYKSKNFFSGCLSKCVSVCAAAL